MGCVLAWLKVHLSAHLRPLGGRYIRPVGRLVARLGLRAELHPPEGRSVGLFVHEGPSRFLW